MTNLENVKRQVAEQILSNLRGRKGLLDGWYNIDEDIREEIIIEIIEVLTVLEENDLD